jgi:UDP-N-acetylmuramoylalanine--D-glutamate ligase
MIVSPAFAGKKYAVLGLARSGMATVECLLASGADVTAWDAREEPRAALEGRATIADPLAIDLAGYAGVVVSPGVPLNTHPIAAQARAAGVPVIGDIELFAQARGDLPPHRVVAITGTNGKSTTTALTHHLMQAAGVPSLMGGNIGKPILEQEPLPAGGVYVLELSSYQIDLTQRLDADVAILLNVSPDHLDRYDGYDAYVASKARLFAMQALGHLAQWPSLQGPHNRTNAAAAVGAARFLGLDDATIAAGLESFVGLPHRMERVAQSNGVLFVNDSKATNPASTAPALAAFPRIHWIVGGLPKGDDLDDCAPHFDHVVRAYTIGEAGPRFASLLEPVMPVTRAEMLGNAVRAAMAEAQPGDVVMLSPACASFDQFRDFEARGDCFRQIVAALTAGS